MNLTTNLKELKEKLDADVNALHSEFTDFKKYLEEQLQTKAKELADQEKKIVSEYDLSVKQTIEKADELLATIK